MRRTLSLVLTLAEMLILSITLVPASTVGCSEIEQATKDLGVVPKLQGKDTRMLCLDGCSLTGPHAWDVEHEITGCEHDDWYCLRASTSMIASYYGGDLSQDRISHYYFEERWAIRPPEGDLGHGYGMRPETLAWALNGATFDYVIGKPSFDQIRDWIDSDRPILRWHKSSMDAPFHATVIDGYTMGTSQIHVIDPWTGTETRIPYTSWGVTSHVWVPPSPSNATARNDEPEIWIDSDSDGIVDFDETNRFFTDPFSDDTDSDGVDDKTEIRSYTFLGNGTFDLQDVLKPDVDEDGLRAELDFDSDNGGCPDGLEDLNHNGVFDFDLGETDPYNATDDSHIPSPVANFEWSPDVLLPMESVTFDASSSYSPDGNIVSYDWNFDDGNTTTVADPITTHLYNTTGNYTITLRITDDKGLWNLFFSNVLVTILGDINSDGVVDIFDVVTIARAFGSEPGDPN